jgi:hypothetical protein
MAPSPQSRVFLRQKKDTMPEKTIIESAAALLTLPFKNKKGH